MVAVDHAQVPDQAVAQRGAGLVVEARVVELVPDARQGLFEDVVERNKRPRRQPFGAAEEVVEQDRLAAELEVVTLQPGEDEEVLRQPVQAIRLGLDVARQVGALTAQCPAAAYMNRYVVVVDDDIDPSDLEQVIWAMSTRSDPARDIETLRMALRAADTGHQVFATVHAARAAQTIERIIAMFPPAEHKVLLSQLAHSLEAIISQRLVVRREEGAGRLPAIEILRGGPVTEKYVLEGKLAQLTEYVEGGTNGMQSFDQHLLQMYGQRLITGTEAMRLASSPEAVASELRGLRPASA